MQGFVPKRSVAHLGSGYDNHLQRQAKKPKTSPKITLNDSFLPSKGPFKRNIISKSQYVASVRPSFHNRF